MLRETTAFWPLPCPNRSLSVARRAESPPAKPPSQLVGVTGPERLQEHERLLLPRGIVARLRFSDLYCTHAQVTWNPLTRV
jgi:hypothetical protein